MYLNLQCTILRVLAGKDRRAKGDFIGAEPILKQLKEGPPRRRVGFIIEGAPARRACYSLMPLPFHDADGSADGAQIYDSDGEKPIGAVTSGIPSPTLGKNIAMGYVLSGHHKKDTPVKIDVRGKKRDAVVTKMPFVESKYWRG